MAERYSIPDRFVDTWAQVQAIPKLDVDHPCFHLCIQLRHEAEGILDEALRRASNLVWLAKGEVDRAGEQAEVPRG